ncbi:SUMF1/EgtB/PvdO family nonheme iron enzyme [Brumimicrobium salinarum]|nr:SUMF1/EgtB/PvdO family nonheme iron enzyme [Brumimicrobium salinarum]
MKIKLFLILVQIILSGLSLANNLKINNVTRPSNDKVSFDLQWDNSWNFNGLSSTAENWDAVWVFVKVQDCNSDFKTWEHGDLSTNSSDHVASGGILTVDAVSDGKGVFIKRQSRGVGNISSTSITLTFQTAYNPSNISLEVFGIEMVSVLDGAFEVGGTSGSYNSLDAGVAFNNGHTISSESAISAGLLKTEGAPNTPSELSYNPSIPANFPKGYNFFYIMKYEITQEQYVNFLNLLNYAQQTVRTSHLPNSPTGTNGLAPNPTSIMNRNGVRIITPGNLSPDNKPAIYGCDLNNNGVFNEADDGQNLACNYLSWPDILAYLDWSGLRPMTELEFEKACRGPLPVVTDEYAWGAKEIIQTSSNTISDAGTKDELSTIEATPVDGLAAINGDSNNDGPLRVGFAASNIPTRAGAGASYWSSLDMTGNLWEQTVSVGYANGNISSFTGVLGDGKLNNSGDADQSGWNLDPTFSIVRGGSYASGDFQSRVGDRVNINSTTYNFNRNPEAGGRGVRQY